MTVQYNNRFILRATRRITRAATVAACLCAAAFSNATVPTPRMPICNITDSLAPVDTVTPGRPQSVGLVLSGGGAKGIAHIGLIQALEENDIPIDYIAGTSMGSIVGGLYAMGYTPAEMMQLIESKEFGYWSTGRVNPDYLYYFSKSQPSPSMFRFPISRPDSAALKAEVPASLISPLPMNFAFMDLFAAYTAQCGGDFNKLMVPFRCVASNVRAGHKVVHASGSLGDAIRTSMSFPIVFQPIRVDGALLYDGGIFDNFPVDVMTADFAPDIMIGVDVSTPAKGPQTSLMDQVENLVMRHQSYAVPADKGIKIKIDVSKFGLLDFPKAQQIYQVGYEKGLAMVDSIKKRVVSRMPRLALDTRRAAFKSQTPYVRFDSINVSGGTASQNKYIDYLFRPAHADTFGIVHARESFYRAITSECLNDLNPQAVYDPNNQLFDLDLKASVKNTFNVGFGGLLASSNNSYVYADAEYKALSFSSPNAKIAGWLGQSYLAAQLTGSINLPTSTPSAIALDVVVSRQRFYQNDQLFYEIQTPTFVLDREYFARFHWDVAAGSRGKFIVSAGIGHINNSFYHSNTLLTADRDRTNFDIAEAAARYNSSTLDNLNYPTKGYAYDFAVIGAIDRYTYKSGVSSTGEQDGNQRWVQGEISTKNYLDLHRHFSLGLCSNIVYSTRPLLDNYNASIVNAPAFNPTVASNFSFNDNFRAYSYVALTMAPVYKYNDNLNARLSLSGFSPMRTISEDAYNKAIYDGWFNRVRFYGEFAVNYALPFGNISAYAAYASAGHSKWSGGVTFGLFVLAPKFLR